MSRRYLNLSSRAWRQLRHNWHLRLSPPLLWQTLVPGTLFSALEALQEVATREQRAAQANFRDVIVILGYWRSGTTLLHELLCLDTRYSYPTTHACMNPHHFLFTEASILASRGASIQRPMDAMEVRSSSPQEDEFAFLSLGARSPYEALLIPAVLPEALKLSDPRELSKQDERRWRQVFVSFLAGVSTRGRGKPMILKSPTHGFRVPTLRELLPDARFILITRDPLTNFESVVRMWSKMFATYAIAPPDLSDDEIREAVLVDRRRFEAKLESSTTDLPRNRFVEIAYESLVQNPTAVLEELYQRLELGDFEIVRETFTQEAKRRSAYRAKATLPSASWQERISREWAGIVKQHASLL